MHWRVKQNAKNAYAAQILGEAFTTAYNAIRVNKDAVDFIADTVLEKQEIFGDELMHLLNSQNLIKPDIDWTAEESWPVFDWSPDPRERRLLQLRGSRPVVRLRGLSVTSADVPFDCFEQVYPASDFVFYISGRSPGELHAAGDGIAWHGSPVAGPSAD